MAFFRPLLQTLISRNQADIETSIPGSDARLRRSNLNIIAKMVSAVAHGLYGYLDYISKQILPDTSEAAFLDRHASLWLTVPRKPASYATGQVVFTGTNGIVVPAGTVLTRSDGIEYDTDADVTIVAGQAIADVTSLTASQNANAVTATALTMVSPIAGINGNVLVHTTAITGGADIEDDDALRTRVLARLKQTPHGGADFDYVSWALEVPGVTRAWVYAQEMGIGTVVVRFVRDDDISLIPDAGEVATVQAYIEARRPVTAQVTVVAPIAVPLNFNIALTPNTLTAKAAVEAELRDLIQREAIPGGTLLLSHIREAISIAAGETNYVMSAPLADVTNTVGNITTFGVITWS
jgi:uncharacterized phage protein gp47/JayE